MAEEKKVLTQEEESNIDQINKFVTSSKDAEDSESERPVEVEELKAEEKEDLRKSEENKKSENKSKKIESEIKKTEHKPINTIKHEAKKVEHAEHQPKRVEPIEKKVEHKKIAPKVEKVEKKLVANTPKILNHNHVKPIIKKSEPKKLPVEPKKEIKEKHTTKKIFSVRKPYKEEKMIKHKEHHKEHKKKFTKNTFLWVGIGILAAVLVIALIFLLTQEKPQLPAGNNTNNSVAAIVNGEPILLQDVLKEYNSLSPVQKSMYTVDSMLNKSIDNILLYQEAKNLGYTVTTEEIQSEIDSIKTQNQLTDADLQKALATQGLTLDDAKSLIEKNLVTRKLLDAKILQGISITEGQIQKYYLQNINKFQVPDKVTIQHILVMTTQNFTDNQSKAKIEQIFKELNATNFCDLVTKYSEDQASVSNCGKYTFAKGEFNNPEFENPSFDLKINETAIVKTVFGYHLIKKLDSIPAGTRNLSEVANEINITLHDDAAQIKFDALVTELRAKATIVNYMTKTDSNESVANTTTPITVATNLDEFAKCITSKGAVFYGASWCTHCANQKKMFGDSMQYVKYIDCEVDGKLTAECTAAGIQGYPTWIINNQKYTGEQSAANLARLTGCTAPQ